MVGKIWLVETVRHWEGKSVARIGWFFFFTNRDELCYKGLFLCRKDLLTRTVLMTTSLLTTRRGVYSMAQIYLYSLYNQPKKKLMILVDGIVVVVEWANGSYSIM